MSSEAPGALPPDAIEVGRVMGAWGIKGAFKVKPFAADPQALFSSKRWFVQPPEAVGPLVVDRASAWPSMLRVVQAKEHGDGVVATAHDVVDRTAAEALKGARIYVSRASFPTPEEGEFYWVDLIGLDVFDRQNALLGTVVGLIETGPHCVLRIHPTGSGDAADEAVAAKDEILIPFVGAYVDGVDLPARRVQVDWDRTF
jgi:16S rRNA processing protein RimM